MAACRDNRTPARCPGDDGFDTRRQRPLLAGTFAWPSDDLDFLSEMLRTQRVPAHLIERLIAHAAAPDRARTPAERLEHALAAHYRFLPLDMALCAPALLVIGPPGAGKTALVAKLAARLDPRRALAIRCDPGNVAGLAQLEDDIGALGIALAVAEDAAALRAVVAGAGRRTAIVDTSAAVPGDAEAAKRLHALRLPSGADIVLALPADLDAAEAGALGAWAGNLGARLMIATRLDLARRLGAVLAAADSGGLAPIAASLAPHFAHGLAPLTAAALARRILGGVSSAAPPPAR